MSRSRKTSRRKARVPKSLGAPCTKLTRVVTANLIKLATDSGTYRSVTLSSVPSSDITSLFQKYRILRVTNVYSLVNAPNNNADFPTLYIAPQEYSNLTNVGSRDEVLQFRGFKQFQFGPATMTFRHSFVPKVFANTDGPAKMVTTSPWLSTATPAAPHMTCIEWLDRYNSTSSPTHTIQLTQILEVEATGTR